jgi:short-chain fatty acids transporter
MYDLQESAHPWSFLAAASGIAQTMQTSRISIARIGATAARLAERIIPEPLSIAIGLFALALAFALPTLGMRGTSAALAKGMLEPGLLAFAFQMALILVGGHAFAEAPPIKRALTRLADVPRTTSSAAALIAFTALLLGLMNWGLALIGGALFAREVRDAFLRRGDAVNGALLGAAGFMGLLVWHGGLSGSAPLKVATTGTFGDAIPVSSTLFSSMNLVVTACLLTVIPALFFALGRDMRLHAFTANEQRREPIVEPAHPPTTKRALALALVIALPLLATLSLAVVESGARSVTLDFVILLFFAGGLVLHGSPSSYQRAFTSGVSSASGVLLQFPIYFAVLALVQASGLMATFARSMVAFASSLPLPVDDAAAVLTFVSASFINVLVPSGGGQWVLQSPVMLETAQSLDVERAKLVMAFAYGDEVTNLLQPFWALPLLAITGLNAGQLMGYTMLAMLVAIPIFLVGLVAF